MAWYSFAHSIFIGRYGFSASAHFWSNTGPVLLCTGPVLDQYIIPAIGPAQDQYQSITGTIFQYWSSTDPILGQYWVSTDLFVRAQ